MDNTAFRFAAGVGVDRSQLPWLIELFETYSDDKHVLLACRRQAVESVSDTDAFVRGVASKSIKVSQKAVINLA
jgi:hypothetical protein